MSKSKRTFSDAEREAWLKGETTDVSAKAFEKSASLDDELRSRVTTLSEDIGAVHASPAAESRPKSARHRWIAAGIVVSALLIGAIILL